MKMFRYAIGENGYCNFVVIDIDSSIRCFEPYSLLYCLAITTTACGEFVMLNKKTGELSLAKDFNCFKELTQSQLNKISNYYWGIEINEIEEVDCESV